VTVARVVPDVTGLDKEFDYLVPDGLEVVVGSRVRVPLHGRRIGGWVVALDVDPVAGPDGLKPIAAFAGTGPPPAVVDLAAWAADRWAGRHRHFLAMASPERRVPAVPRPDRTGRAPGPASPATAELLRAGGGVLRLPPTADQVPAILSAAALGPCLVVVPETDHARLTAARLRRAGLSVALLPDDWAQAAGGVDVTIGARSAVWAPCPDLAAVVVLDEHDEALQSEASPTWHARDVAVERARRAGVPVVLVSPVPTVAALEVGPLRHPDRNRERRAWPVVELVDRSDDAPWRRSMLTSRVIGLLRDPAVRIACVLDRLGRSRLLACRTCRSLARCTTCSAAVRQHDDERLVCERCGTVRPLVCAACGASGFANLRPGVTQLRREIEAAAGREVVTVTGGETGLLADAGVYVGTSAVLHRLDRADVVAFLDIDREITAPRLHAHEQALGQVAAAARLVGPRERGGRVLLQTFVPDDPFLRDVVLADPGRITHRDAEQRRLLGLPPYGGLATVSGAGAAEFVASLRGVEVGETSDGYLVRCDDPMALGAALRAGHRPAGSRLRVAVDPAR
jgi:primosomal protein N' (replication factor Y)